MLNRFKKTTLAVVAAAAVAMHADVVSAYTISGNDNAFAAAVPAAGPFGSGCFDASVQPVLDFGGGFITTGNALIRFLAGTNNNFGQLDHDGVTVTSTYLRDESNITVLQSCADPGTTVTSISWNTPSNGTPIPGSSSAFFMTIDYSDSSNDAFTCRVGWTGGFGTDLVAECAAVSPPDTTSPTVADTQKKISGFTVGRLNRLTTSQSGLVRFLRKDVRNSFNANSRLNFASIDGSVSSGNAWAKLTGTKSNSGSYVLGSLGAHTFVSENFLLGGMLQLDYAEDDANKISGKGWLVGPYFVAKHSTQPLFFEGRLLYGQTDNEITPLGTFTDNFKTARWLAQFRTTGEVSYNTATLMPLLDLTYADDTQKTYTDSLGNIISGKTVELMQLTAGMDFRVPVSVQTGSLDLTGGVSGIYSSTSDGNADYEGLRGRADLGIEYSLGEAGTLDVNTFVDGLGSDYQGHGMDIGYNLKF